MYGHQSPDDNRNLKVTSKSIKSMAKFKYSQTSFHELNSFLKVVRKPKLFSP
jgi:hypothetical protein